MAFVLRLNSLLSRSIGLVVRDRFKSPRLQDERALIQQMIYHDLNEVRAGKAQDPRENELSSYPHYAYGISDPLITDPEFYLKLGKTRKERQSAYRAMVLEILVAAPRKKNGVYTGQLYIGDPQWVQIKYEELRALRRNNCASMFVSPGSDPPF